MKKLALIALVLVLGACGKKAETPAPAEPAQPAATAEKPAAAPAEAPKPAEPAPAPAAAGLAIAKLNLKIDAPADSTITDMMGSQMIMGPSWVVTIKEAGENDAKTLDAAKKESETFTPKNGKDETLPDGWVYSFENTGDAGTNYWLNSFRTIGGKGYRCDTTCSSPEQLAGAIAACKSLKQ